jgi:hypothetical protein
MEKFYKIFEI